MNRLLPITFALALAAILLLAPTAPIAEAQPTFKYNYTAISGFEYVVSGGGTFNPGTGSATGSGAINDARPAGLGGLSFRITGVTSGDENSATLTGIVLLSDKGFMGTLTVVLSEPGTIAVTIDNTGDSASYSGNVVIR